VSHDRTFLDNVVTSTLVFEGEGKVGEYAGGYEDWARYRRRLAGERTELPKRAGKPPAAAALEEKRGNSTRKLSYKEQRELEALPGKIESLEAEQSRLHTVTSDAEFYKQPGDKIGAAMERLEAATNELEACYARWQSLESDR
ncbi:MAG: ABC transporter ATP-binding protein, partial [Candidatus Binatota bacterium]